MSKIVALALFALVTAGMVGCGGTTSVSTSPTGVTKTTTK